MQVVEEEQARIDHRLRSTAPLWERGDSVPLLWGGVQLRQYGKICCFDDALRPKPHQGHTSDT
jgi:hypothetical protein